VCVCVCVCVCVLAWVWQNRSIVRTLVHWCQQFLWRLFVCFSPDGFCVDLADSSHVAPTDICCVVHT
jgi:hypothetical protein